MAQTVATKSEYEISERSIKPQTIATAAIGGICACFYNKETNCWELAFPFDETHKLAITIDENGIPLSDTPIEVGLGDDVFIKVKNPTKNHKPFHGNASPNWDDIKIDERDFGWFFCIDGNHAHSNGVKWKNNAQIIRCSIENACFYTTEQTQDYYILRRFGEDTAKWLGRMGKKLAQIFFVKKAERFYFKSSMEILLSLNKFLLNVKMLYMGLTSTMIAAILPKRVTISIFTIISLNQPIMTNLSY